MFLFWHVCWWSVDWSLCKWMILNAVVVVVVVERVAITNCFSLVLICSIFSDTKRTLIKCTSFVNVNDRVRHCVCASKLLLFVYLCACFSSLLLLSLAFSQFSTKNKERENNWDDIFFLHLVFPLRLSLFLSFVCSNKALKLITLLLH